MKYYNPQVLIPWYDDGMKQWMRMQFNGIVDYRRLRREVRKQCKKAFNKTVNRDFISFDCQYLKPTEKELINSLGADNLISILQREHDELENEQAGTDTETTGYNNC